MKMKTIFLLLNAVLTAAFAVIFLTPLFLLGGDWFTVFWSRNWPIAIVFVVTLGAVDGYFLLNWRLFRGLEREDWATVAGILERRVFSGRWMLPGQLRLLLNTYLVASNTEAIRALEAYLTQHRPALIPRFSVAFGIPHLIAKDPSDPEEFFRRLLENRRLSDRDWVKWNHAFSLLQLKREAEAKSELSELAQSTKEPVLLLLVLYLVEVTGGSEEQRDLLTARKTELRSRYAPVAMQRAIEQSGANLQVLVLSRLLQDARDWLYREDAAPKEAPKVAPPESPAP